MCATDHSLSSGKVLYRTCSKGTQKTREKLLKYSLFPGQGLNSRPSTYEAACRSFECANPSGFLFLSPSNLQMFS